MPPKVKTLTQQLKNIRLVHKGDVDKFLHNVKSLVEAGADVRVLNDYRKGESIVSEYVLTARDTNIAVLCRVAKALFDLGVAATPRVFLDCLFTTNDSILADIVLKAAEDNHQPIDINTLNIYGTPVIDWVGKEIITQGVKYISIIIYLKKKGLRTNEKKYSIDDIQKIQNRIF